MISRSGFLVAAAGAAVCLGVANGDVRIPAELRGGRFFAMPRLRDGNILACWLDTDSNGFIFRDVAEHLKLPTHDDAGSSFATPPVLGVGPLLVIDRPADDPIMQGFGAQIGAPWFAGHTWEFDYRAGTLARLARGLRASANTVQVGIDANYARVLVTVSGESYNASFDTAATMVTRQGVVGTSLVPSRTLDSWHRGHTDWPVGGIAEGVYGIIVPEVRLGSILLRNVEFTTRPNDDAFQSDDVDLKLGPNAFAGRVATLDYPGKLLAVS